MSAQGDRTKTNDVVVKATLEAWYRLIEDVPLADTSLYKGYEKGKQWWQNYFATTPFDIICEAMSGLRSAFLANLRFAQDDSMSSVFLPWIAQLPLVGKVYIDFKKNELSFFSLSPIEQDSILHKVQWMLSVLKFGTKAVLEKPELKTEALGRWKENEERLSRIRLPSYLTNFLARIYKSILPSFVDETLAPKHGSGAVAEQRVRGLALKLDRRPALPEKIARMYYSVPDKMKRGRNRSKAWSLEQSWPYDFGSKKVISNYPLVRSNEDVQSKLDFVAKSYKTLRTIAYEPVDQMYYQQAVLYMFVKTFEGTDLRYFIDLKDQRRNGQHALLASLDRKSVSVDAKDASDNILARLVRQVLPYSIWKHILAVKTDYISLPDGTVVKPQKLSPMGAAITFPLQSTMFLTLVLASYIVQYYGGLPETLEYVRDMPIEVRMKVIIQQLVDYSIFDDLWSWIKQNVHLTTDNRSVSKFMVPHVYGDDVFVDERSYEYYDLMCKLVGFVNNKDKTFSGDATFRESCGVEAWNGRDVTPIYWKTPYHMRNTKELLASLVGLANRSYLHGYKNLRSYAINRILRDYWPVKRYNGITSIRFTNDVSDSSKVHTSTPDLNWHLPLREYDPNHHGITYTTDTHILYQRDERRGFVVKYTEDLDMKVLQARDKKHDDYRYIQSSRMQERQQPSVGLDLADLGMGPYGAPKIETPLAIRGIAKKVYVTYGWSP